MSKPYGLYSGNYTLKDESLGASQRHVFVVDVQKNSVGIWQVIYFDNCGRGNIKTMKAHKFRKLYLRDPKYINRP